MPAILGAHHTSFTVAHLEKSLEFFRDKLGFELVFTREIKEDYFARIVGHPGCVVKAALFRIPGSTHHIELFEYVSPRGETFRPRPCDPGSSHLSLLVDDLPGLYAQFRGKNMDFADEPVLITNGPNKGGYGVYLRDPNGVLIEFFQPPRQNPS